MQTIHINLMDNVDLSQGPSQKYQRYNLYFCAGQVVMFFTLDRKHGTKELVSSLNVHTSNVCSHQYILSISEKAHLQP